MQKVGKKVPKKMWTTKSCLSVKRFSILRRNSIAKMTIYLLKVVTRPKTSLRGSEGSSTRPPSVVMVWWVFCTRCDPDSFFRCRHKNKWWGLLSRVKWCLATPWRKLYLWKKMSGTFNRILCPLTKKKNVKMVARAHPRIHPSGRLALLQPRPQSIGL